ncbi:asparagine synthase-related protein [Streptomyces sp. e14]|uniref:asparagine synthase-related protein n=1 Tax=Streptomyces sp. e14 TaxID=645465 RepID=UPI0002E98B19|nr:asparagine synthase-related protein [Streptomyces sp. e14]
MSQLGTAGGDRLRGSFSTRADGRPDRATDDVAVWVEGRIHNSAEIRAKLARHGGDGHPSSGLRCLLRSLYLAHGADFARGLDGEFAVVVADRRGPRRLVACTDRSGVRRLYYTWRPEEQRVWFATELPALLGMAGVDVAEHEGALDAYLAAGAQLGEHTMFRGVKVLPPGAALLVSPDGPRLRTRPEEDTEPARADPTRRPGARLRALLHEQLLGLPAADPVAVITSGRPGADLLARVAAASGRPFHVFHGGWPSAARGIAGVPRPGRTPRTIHHWVEVRPDTVPDRLWRPLGQLGQPHADPELLLTHVLCSAAQEAGSRTIVAGNGGDELFAGHPRVADALSAPAGLAWVPRYLDQLAAVPRALRTRLYTAEYASSLRRHGPALPAGLTETAQRRGARPGPPGPHRRTAVRTAHAGPARPAPAGPFDPGAAVLPPPRGSGWRPHSRTGTRQRRGPPRCSPRPPAACRSSARRAPRRRSSARN